MKTKLLRLAAASLIISLAAALAAKAPTATAADAQWTASYWNNTTLKGTPVVDSQTEDRIAYNWGRKSPIPGTVNKDKFSVRWTRTMDFNGATYVFRTISDDGIRVWVDGDKIIDQWNDHAFQTYIATVDMSEGEHTLKVEYYENKGLSTVNVSWTPLWDNPWRAQYFKGTSLGGKVIVDRDENGIRNFWGAASPAPGVSAMNFSVRYTRTVTFPGGDVRFKVTVSDGFRLYVGKNLIMDKWYDHGVQTHTAKESIAAGDRTVRLEFYNHSYPAVLKLKMSVP